jgi:electron transport complex protein RnfG
MSKVRFFVQQSWLLLAASCFFGLLLAIAQAAWGPRIEQNRVDKLNRLMSDLLGDAESFEPVAELDIDSGKGQTQETTLYIASAGGGGTVGYCFIASGSGFADKIELVVAVDAAFGKIAGFNVLFSNETPGFGDQIKLPYYRDQFVNAPATELHLVKSGNPEDIDANIVAISGATVSSDAVVSTFNNTLGQVKQQMEQKGLIR